MDEEEYRYQVLERLELIVHQLSFLTAVGCVIVACLGALPVQIVAGLLAAFFAVRSLSGFLAQAKRIRRG